MYFVFQIRYIIGGDLPQVGPFYLNQGEEDNEYKYILTIQIVDSYGEATAYDIAVQVIEKYT